MDTRLTEAPYLAGEDYSIADMACWSWIRAARAIEIDLSDYPALNDWFARVGERPAVKKGAHVPEGNHQLRTQTVKMAVTPEQWANMFQHDMQGRPLPGAPA
jgi:GST-like protein